VLERVQMCERECVAIAKMKRSERCNHVGVERHRNTHTHTHTREWAETTKRVENVTEEGPM